MLDHNFLPHTGAVRCVYSDEAKGKRSAHCMHQPDAKRQKGQQHLGADKQQEQLRSTACNGDPGGGGAPGWDPDVESAVRRFLQGHLDPLFKADVLTREQYKAVVYKVLGKVMRSHAKAKDAKFLIKEGEQIRKLAQQYVEIVCARGPTL